MTFGQEIRQEIKMDFVSIGTIDDWDVSILPWPSYGEHGVWWTVKAKHKDAKGAYWLNWNGRRFADSVPLYRLYERNPSLHEELLKKLAAWSAGKADAISAAHCGHATSQEDA
jgi:hypothetical protein